MVIFRPLESGDARHNDLVVPLNFYRGLSKNQIRSKIGVYSKASQAFAGRVS
jgi:hypothetical protein